jgi:hypothetical protein
MAILNLCQVWFYIMFPKKNGVCAGQSTWRVLSWHGYGSGYSKGTAEVMENGHV